MSDTFEPNELYRLENVVLDVARNFGNESTQSKDRIKRMINRAATRIIGHDRKWSWLYVVDSFETAADVETYSLNQDTRSLLMLWKTGDNRGPIDRIPSRQFRKYVPDESTYSGVPRLWDEAGVDTNGSKVISLFPVPDNTYTVKYQYYRHLLPVRNDQTNLWAYWGMPPNIIEILIQMATALTFKGIDDDRYQTDIAEAEAMIVDAYAADQEKGNTIIRAPAEDPDNFFSDGPMMPWNFGP
jgi:hypothetical protein